MTARKLDYVLYVNARKWAASVGIHIDEADEPMLSKEAVIDITGRDMPVVFRGHRPASYTRMQQMRAKAGARSSGAVLPKKKKEESKTEGTVQDDEDRRVVFVIAPESNPFGKKEEIARITYYIPMDGSAEVILASKIVAPQLASEWFLQNITHDILAYNPLPRCGDMKLIREPDVIKNKVLYDIISSNLAGIAKIRASTDPCVFWLDGHPDDIIKVMPHAEDTCVDFRYLHIVR